MHSSNFKREKFQRIRKLSKCAKIKVSLVFISIFQRCTLEALIFCLSCQRIWLMLYVYLCGISVWQGQHSFPLITIFIIALAPRFREFPIATMPPPIFKCVWVCSYLIVTCTLFHWLVMDTCWTTTGAPNGFVVTVIVGVAALFCQGTLELWILLAEAIGMVKLLCGKSRATYERTTFQPFKKPR